MLNGPKSDYRFVDTAIMARLAAIPLMSRKPMLGSVSGRHNSPHRGSSVEFAEYRKYVPGDDLRRLDWRAYGRSDRYYVKEFEADTNLRCVLVVDSSGSMAYTSGTVTKLDYAKKIAATLGYLAIQQGDAAGLCCISDDIVQSIPPRRNPAHLSILWDALNRTEAKGATKLPELLHQIAETTRQRALILIVSDFFSDPALLKNCFEHLRFRKHDISLFHLLDPEELAFTFQRPTRFLDLEGGPSIFVEPFEIADRYQTALQEYLTNLHRVALETNSDYMRIAIDQNYETVLSQFLIRRTHQRSVR